jgi:hypothetical protein
MKQIYKEDIQKLSDEAFEALARKQCTLYPDLLDCMREEDVITCFYEYYARRRKHVEM